MKVFNNILCSYDFSEHADRALDRALQLCSACGEKLTVVHVLVNPFLYEGGSPLLRNNVLAIDLLGKMREDEQKNLDALKAKIADSHPQVPVDIVVEEDNDIGEAVIAVQERTGADLIVIGSHGRKGIRRVFLGSVAEGVLRNANCPVLIVK
ncbi:MAG: universal stress protein [Saprospiraceae bacterium]|jgi:nucleotide-binding universal stress UspA family protein|nr:universal stress protein [Saprospiraceae bacterium]MBP9210286.1 universal stress protein [Saprospiraceae bacterium]MBV6473803.1 TRAP-T-associated universal stress protein TeaD [Saprospiraceae bacterium]